MTETRLRLRAALDDHRTLVIVAFVVVLAAGAWMTYGTHVDSGEEVEQRPIDSWAVSGDVTHGAEITRENAVFENGSEFRNEPVYYTELSPTATGEFTIRYHASTGENVTISMVPELVYRSVDDDVVYWERSRELSQTTASDVEPDEPVTANFDVDVTAIESEIDEIETDLGASPGEPSTFIRADIQIEGEIDGQHRTVSQSERMTVSPDGSTYSFDDDDTFEKTFDEYETTSVTQSDGSTRTIGGPLLLLLGGVGLIGIVIADRRLPELTDEERRWLAYTADRDEFGDLSTTATLPTELLDRPRCDVASFGELAQLAIDLETALIQERTDDCYVVPVEGVLYVYAPPEPPTTDSSTESATDEPQREDEQGFEFTENAGETIDSEDSDGATVPDESPTGDTEK